jgi:CheY-like chemotaxis protein
MTAINSAGLAVLVIDDHAVLRDTLARQLRQMSFQNIDTAATIAEASSCMAKKTYDIILVDWAMREKSGATVLAECRQDRRYDRTAFIMVGTKAEEAQMRAANAVCIVKPVQAEQFSQSLRQATEALEIPEKSRRLPG